MKLNGLNAYQDWDQYVQSMGPWFGAPVHDDLLADLRNLRQTRTLQGYIDEFDMLYP